MSKLKILNFLEEDKLKFLLISLFPIFLILGNLLINFFYVALTTISILNLEKNKKFYNCPIFYLLLFFFSSLVVNLIFSINIGNSFPRILKFILIIFVIIEIQKLYFSNVKELDKIIKFWSIIFLIVTVDIIFELILGFNSIGFVAEYPGRIASFFGDELIVGSFYHFFGLIFIGYLLNKKYPHQIILMLGIFIIFISLMIGERANFLKMFFSIFFILFFFLKINFYKKLISLLIIITVIFLIISQNDTFKNRYYNQLKSIYNLNGLEKYLKQSQYGAHQDAALQIFKNHKLFGVGVKNFRIESGKEIYENIEYKKTHSRQANHPHQIHFELLSEMGLTGYISFFILMICSIYLSLKNFYKNKNFIQLSTVMFLFTNLLPLLPSGSILSTYFGGIFWLNYALMISFNSNVRS